MPDRETEKDTVNSALESAAHSADEPCPAEAYATKTDAGTDAGADAGAGRALGIRAHGHSGRRSAYDLLPAPLRDARARLEREFAAEKAAKAAGNAGDGGDAADGSANPDGEITLRFAERFRRLTARKEQPQGGKMKGFFQRRSASAYVVAALLFVVWMGYTHFYGTDETVMSFADLKSRVPMRIDSHTVLSAAEQNADGVFLTVEKEKGAFEGMSDAEIAAAMDKIAVNAQSLCSNELFNRLIRSGTVLHVSLNSEDGQISRESTISQCPTTQGTR